MQNKFNSTKKGSHFQRLVITDDDIEKYTHQYNLTLSIQVKLEFCLPINLVSDMFEYLHVYTTEDETSLISTTICLSVYLSVRLADHGTIVVCSRRMFPRCLQEHWYSIPRSTRPYTSLADSIMSERSESCPIT